MKIDHAGIWLAMSCGGDVAHFQVAALERDEFGALLEQRATEVEFDGGVVLHRLGELLHHVGADVLLGHHGRESQRRLVLGEAVGRRSGKDGAGEQRSTRH